MRGEHQARALVIASAFGFQLYLTFTAFHFKRDNFIP